MDRPGYVYIMASARNGTIYIGSTSDLAQRGGSTATARLSGSPSATAATFSSGTKPMLRSTARDCANCR